MTESPPPYVEHARWGDEGWTVLVVRPGRRSEERTGATHEQLARTLMALREDGVALAADQHGWGPDEVFDDLRARGLAFGGYVRISWSGPGEHMLTEVP